MAITKDTGRQWPLVASVDIAFGDAPTTATYYEALDLPVGARVVSGALVVTTAWATSTTSLFAVGDTVAADRYLTSTTIAAAGTTVFDFAGDTGVAAEDIGVTYTETGSAADAGAATLYVQYVIDGKANEVQPTADV